MDRLRDQKGKSTAASAGQQERKPYAKPRLIEYGSVKNLTQGQAGSGSDSLNVMTP